MNYFLHINEFNGQTKVVFFIAPRRGWSRSSLAGSGGIETLHFMTGINLVEISIPKKFSVCICFLISFQGLIKGILEI
jgi:hypothetical protein